MSVEYLEAAEVEKLVKDPNVLIVDVRDSERGEDGHISGSVHFPSTSFADKIDTLKEEAKGKSTIVFHCALSQVRGPTCARHFANEFQEKGINGSKIFVLEKGFNGWKASGKGVCSCEGATCKA